MEHGAPPRKVGSPRCPVGAVALLTAPRRLVPRICQGAGSYPLPGIRLLYFAGDPTKWGPKNGLQGGTVEAGGDGVKMKWQVEGLLQIVAVSHAAKPIIKRRYLAAGQVVTHKVRQAANPRTGAGTPFAPSGGSSIRLARTA